MVQQGYGLGRGAHQSEPKSCRPDWQVAQSYRSCTFVIDDTVLVADDVLVHVTRIQMVARAPGHTIQQHGVSGRLVRHSRHEAFATFG
jgi:hypothetical protein